nr:hypothetical protein [Tanacetum cinerariifolium]
MIVDLSGITTSLPNETLFIYLEALKEAVSAVLLVVRKGKQYLVRYVSKTLHDAKRNYASLEEMALALRHVSRRPRRYFKAHHITIIIDQPVKQILTKADTSGEASSVKGSGTGLVLIIPTKTEYTYALRLNFESTNNQVEYEALLAGLRIAKKIGIQSLSADVLSKLALVAFNHLTKEVLVETLDMPSTNVEKINAVAKEEGETWKTPIINCLERGMWPKDKNEACALRIKIGPLQANNVIHEIHMGACNIHLKARSMVVKAIRQGYYWPTMHQDVREEIRKCDSCQIYSLIPKIPKTLMT